MANNNYIGGLEEVVLLTIHSLGNDAYGVLIHEELESAGRKISIGSLYTTLSRLEDKKYVSSVDKDATKERGGRAKRYFKLTSQGAKALNDAQDVRQNVLARNGRSLPWPA